MNRAIDLGLTSAIAIRPSISARWRRISGSISGSPERSTIAISSRAVCSRIEILRWVSARSSRSSSSASVRSHNHPSRPGLELRTGRGGFVAGRRHGSRLASGLRARRRRGAEELAPGRRKPLFDDAGLVIGNSPPKERIELPGEFSPNSLMKLSALTFSAIPLVVIVSAVLCGAQDDLLRVLDHPHIPLPLPSALLSPSRSHRMLVGLDARKRHPQPIYRAIA